MTTRKHHDLCLAAYKALITRDPELVAKATAPGVWLDEGSPELRMKRALDALAGVASTFATGQRLSRAIHRRAARLVAAYEASQANADATN